MMKKIFYQDYEILGHKYLIAATEEGLAFVGSQDQDVSELSRFYPDAELVETKLNKLYFDQIKEYLSGQRKQFTLPLDISGTEFQKNVWQALQEIPYGQTTTYTQLAQKIGHDKASRAVGTAVGKNPLLMVIPCHRVITKTGQLGGYRGGMSMKKSLLELEK
ncbi:methylated-DNA--[protein]-cysteine S-methyltransferase [Companilactobacillus sp. FL22-1]|uniref:methylated-DNA--[protein]-cysteine S-methyltransferase n=1 Tax=Companilactobacillus sp. FL22-1 TaxID=3373892 RepID=UPI0037549E5E